MKAQAFKTFMGFAGVFVLLVVYWAIKRTNSRYCNDYGSSTTTILGKIIAGAVRLALPTTGDLNNQIQAEGASSTIIVLLTTESLFPSID